MPSDIPCRNCAINTSSQICLCGDRRIPVCDCCSEILNYVGETTEPLEYRYIDLEEHSFKPLIKTCLITKIEDEQRSHIEQYRQLCELPVEKSGTLLLKEENSPLKAESYRHANFTISEISNELKICSNIRERRSQSFSLDEMYIHFTSSDGILQIWVVKPNERNYWTSLFVKSSDEQNVEDWFFAIYFAKCNILLKEPRNLNRDSFITFSHQYVKQGYLYKSRPNSVGRDNLRWIVLHIDYILYYKNVFDSQPKNEIPILGRRKRIMVETIPSSDFDQYHKFSLKVAERSYYFHSHSKDNRDSWVECIKKCLDPKL